VIGLMQVGMGLLQRYRRRRLSTPLRVMEQHGSAVPRHHPPGDNGCAIRQFERRLVWILEEDPTLSAFSHDHSWPDWGKHRQLPAVIESRLEGESPVGR